MMASQQTNHLDTTPDSTGYIDRYSQHLHSKTNYRLGGQSEPLNHISPLDEEHLNSTTK